MKPKRNKNCITKAPAKATTIPAARAQDELMKSLHAALAVEDGYEIVGASFHLVKSCCGHGDAHHPAPAVNPPVPNPSLKSLSSTLQQLEKYHMSRPPRGTPNPDGTPAQNEPTLTEIINAATTYMRLPTSPLEAPLGRKTQTETSLEEIIESQAISEQHRPQETNQKPSQEQKPQVPQEPGQQPPRETDSRSSVVPHDVLASIKDLPNEITKKIAESEELMCNIQKHMREIEQFARSWNVKGKSLYQHIEERKLADTTGVCDEEDGGGGSQTPSMPTEESSAMV